MDFPSKSLILSLNQDLKILNKINTKIISNYKSIEINSWLHPTKNYNETKSEICLNTSSGNKLYLSYLELLIDRIYLMLNLFLRIVDSFKISECRSKNVMRPKTLSLGASADYLWKNLLHVKEIIVDYQDPVRRLNRLDNPFLKNQDVQTEMSCLDQCSTCAIASACIEELVRELAADVDAIWIQKIRKNLEDDIYNITKQGCMRQITDAIIQDLKSFVQELKVTKTQNENYETQIKDITSKYNQVLEIEKRLQLSLKKLKKQTLNEKLKKESIVRKIDEVLEIKMSDSNKILTWQQKSITILKTLEENKENLSLLTENNAKLKREIGEALVQKVQISGDRDLWKNRFGEIYLDNRQLNQKLERYKPIIQRMNEILKKINDNYVELTTKLENHNNIILQKAQFFENFIQKLKNLEEIHFIKSNNVGDGPTLNCVSLVSPFKITGNPLHDMQQQVQINISNITKLQHDNNQLLSTITKFQKKTVCT